MSRTAAAVTGLAGLAATGLAAGVDTPLRDSAQDPVRLVFEWEYTDHRGPLSGSGAARANPPGSFRLDLFTGADGSLSAALVDGRLTANSDIQDFDLPPARFLYAMAGVFWNDAPSAGEDPPQADGSVELLEPDNSTVVFRFDGGGRIVRVEQRYRGTLIRRADLSWDSNSPWPSEARYRDDERQNGVRWRIQLVDPAAAPWPDEVFVIPGGRVVPE